MKEGCQKGKPCGSSCIERSKKCKKSLAPGLSKKIKTVVGTVTGRPNIRAGGQSLQGNNLDYEELDRRTSEWLKSLGLDPDFAAPGHDETHVLVRDYMGKTSEQIARLLGGKGKGPSILEEIFVEVIEDLTRKPRDLRYLFFKSSGEKTGLVSSIEGSISVSAAMGFISKEDPIYKNQERTINSIRRLFLKMSEREDFDTFLDTVKLARRMAREKPSSL